MLINYFQPAGSCFRSYTSLKLISALLLVSIQLTACDKEDETVQTIDVAAQWYFDANGNIIDSPGDSQWQQQSFTDRELALFQSLDTASLSGTAAPEAMGRNLQHPFPNPFQNQHALSFRFNQTFSGTVLLKYVIVDANFNAVQKLAGKLTAQSGNTAVSVAPGVEADKYRLYYTLSAQGKPHFYQSWGNIEKL